MEPDSLHASFNYVEAALWTGLGFFLLAAYRRTKRKVACLSALLFLAFAVTDLVEVRSGAWWRPTWLLAAKAAIAAGLVLCFLAYRRTRLVEQHATIESRENG